MFRRSMAFPSLLPSLSKEPSNLKVMGWIPLPAPTQDTLPAGGLRLCRTGVEPAGLLRKVSGHPILVSTTYPGARQIATPESGSNPHHQWQLAAFTLLGRLQLPVGSVCFTRRLRHLQFSTSFVTPPRYLREVDQCLRCGTLGQEVIGQSAPAEESPRRNLAPSLVAVDCKPARFVGLTVIGK